MPSGFTPPPPRPPSARRDGGDCTSVFLNAGESALQTCDRAQCPCNDQNLNQHCWPFCFTAACDWSRSRCKPERASLTQCPVFDAAALQSSRRAQSNGTLLFMLGGSSRRAPVPATHELN